MAFSGTRIITKVSSPGRALAMTPVFKGQLSNFSREEFHTNT